jgi:hypothetical protein
MTMRPGQPFPLSREARRYLWAFDEWLNHPSTLNLAFRRMTLVDLVAPASEKRRPLSSFYGREAG